MPLPHASENIANKIKSETRATLSVTLYARQMHLHGIIFTI